jgi:RNA polymerase primary sigma factor
MEIPMGYNFLYKKDGALTEVNEEFASEEIREEEYTKLKLVNSAHHYAENLSPDYFQVDDVKEKTDADFEENAEQLYSDLQGITLSSLALYFKTVSRFSLLTEEEEIILAKKIKESEEKLKNLVIQWKQTFKKDFAGRLSVTHMKEVCRESQQVNDIFRLFDDLLKLERERKEVNRAIKRLNHTSDVTKELHEQLYKCEKEISKSIAQINLTEPTIIIVIRAFEKTSNGTKKTKRHQYAKQVLIMMLREISHASMEIKIAKNELIQANLRIVISIAKKYSRYGIPLSDLIQEGNLGLIRATDTYDYRRGYRFITYAVWWIRQAIIRALVCQSRTVRTPVYINDKMNQIEKASDQLLHKFNREPTLEEIAETTKTPLKTVEKVVQSFKDAVSIEAFAEGNSDMLVNSSLNDKNNSIVEGVISSDLSQALEMILSDLSQRERKIAKLRFGIGEKHDHNLEEIGKEFNLSRERIRQISENILKKLKAPNNVRKLKEFVEFN